MGQEFLPAYLRVKAAVHFSTDFGQKQSGLVDRFRHFANMPKSQWKRAAVADPKKAHIINTLEDFREFLLGIQRVPSNSMAFSARCRPPRQQPIQNSTQPRQQPIRVLGQLRPSLAAGSRRRRSSRAAAPK